MSILRGVVLSSASFFALSFFHAAAAAQTAGRPAMQVANAMPDGAAVHPPAGFVSFCMRNPTQCKDDRPPDSAVHLDAKTRGLIVSVNDRVNRTTTWVDDETLTGQREHFGFVRNGKGDCDDIALTKREILHSGGIPLHDLRLAIGRNPKGELHAVLLVTTDQGDLVLDSPDTQIRDWQHARISFLKRQDGSALGWESVPARM